MIWSHSYRKNNSRFYFYLKFMFFFKMICPQEDNYIYNDIGVAVK